MNRDHIVSIRLTKAEYAALKARGGRISDIIRSAIGKKTQEPPANGVSIGSVVPMWWGEWWLGQTYPTTNTR